MRIQRISQDVVSELAEMRAMAKKFMPSAISTEAIPQHAPAKYAEFNVTANVPNTVAGTDNLSEQKKVQAPIPKINSAKG
jgi:hypothetical protein